MATTCSPESHLDRWRTQSACASNGLLPVLGGGDAQTAAIAGVFAASQDVALQNPDDEAWRAAIANADKYKPISCAAGQNEKVVTGPLLFGLCATGYAFPIPHCPMSITLTLASTAADVCAQNASTTRYLHGHLYGC